MKVITFATVPLNTKRHGFEKDWWKFRVDKHYRMVGKEIDGKFILHSVGTRDEDLRKKQPAITIMEI